MTALLVTLLVFVTIGLVYAGRGYWAWVLAAAGALGICAYAGVVAPAALGIAGAALLALAAATGIPALRRRLVSSWALRLAAGVLPRMGDTERIALEAGTVWWDGDLFSGDPDWKKLLDFAIRPLSQRERAFLEGPVEELCAMLNEWQVEQEGDLPPEAWKFIKENRFFGMIIPEAYGGLGFSAAAHSAVVSKIASRSVTAAVTVMVPNSLGPGELLLHYGTEEQKRHYLPRLAAGLEIPCFALTGPEAGSDAAATQSIGIVCRGKYRGGEVLGIRLNWRKRYITLGPVSTLIGLAFKLCDPDRLLGGGEDCGITVALVPSNTPGIEIGKRHDPMGIPFQNGPITGTDVFVPLDFIIGGRKMASQGWRMLMESLAAGRSISLPALSVGAAELATRVVGAYATVREQFDTPIGRFEGIEEPLARIGGLTYLMNAARVLTAAAVDAGEKPAVVSAIVKCYLTESMRRVISDAMDIRAGAAICRGPRNILARALMASPIGITVEGANILTRSMIIYGQGAIRCHPFVREEMAAVASNDVARFDRAFFGHVNFVCKNAARAFLLGLTGARLARAPVGGPLGGYLRDLTRWSAAFALVSDAAMATLGGTLKRREKISGRLADALAWMYLASAAGKRFWDLGQPAYALPFLRWSCEHALQQIQEALAGVLDNLPNRAAAWLLRPLVFPFGARRRPPTDALGAQVARALLEDGEERLRLTSDIYSPPATEPGLGRLEAALHKAVAALAVETKVRDAVRAGRIDRAPGDALLELGLQAGVITQEERQRIREADEARDEVIQVDAFEKEEYRRLRR
ncbi:MAG: acyl-CoA dehydrogenase [Candidatus Rokubacteria bacterium]|nr:acyl-CoA dehydrogenase [Candidatus Rokubacteria bacterium]